MDITNLLLGGDYDTIQNLINEKKKIRFKQIGNYILHEIAKTKYVDIANIFLKKKYNVNTLDINHNIPLNIAIRENNTEMIKLFIEYNSKIFKKNIDELNSIDIAIKSNINILKILKNSKKKDKNGDSILHYLIKSGQLTIDILNIFIEDINLLNKNKQTPLHYSMIYKVNNEMIVNNLINKKNINMQDKNKNTALHYAYDNDNILSSKILDILISNNADIKIVNQKKKIPIQLSKKNRIRRQTFFKNMEYDILLDHLNSIIGYKQENVAKVINTSLKQTKGNISEINDKIKKDINNLDSMMITVDKNDKRYKQKFYRGIKDDDVKLFHRGNKITTYNYSSVTSEKKIALQFTNIKYNTDNNCCILVFSIPYYIKRIDLRELEMMDLLVNTNEKEIILERNLTWIVKRRSGNKIYVELQNVN